MMGLDLVSTVDDVAAETVELANTVRREHDAALACARDVLSHAIKAGAALMEAQGQVPNGEWLRWIERECGLSISVAESYMRVAHYKDMVEGASSVKQALSMVAGAPRLNAPDEDIKRHARELVRRGHGIREVSRMLGVTHPTVLRWVDKEARKHQRDYWREYRRRGAAAARALRREEARQAAMKIGGDFGPAMTEAIRLCEKLAKAREQFPEGSAERERADRAYSKIAEAESELTALALGAA